MHRRTLLLLTLLFILPVFVRAQTVGVKQYIQQVASGWTSDAKKALPDLLIDNPDDPGVLFLHASLVEDPKKAAPLLERIVDAYPKSEWADDALARLVIFAATKGEADKAKKTFITMREQYSQSELLPVVYDVMRSTVGAPPPGDRTVAAPAPKKAEPVAETPAKTAAKAYTLVTRTTFSKDEADGLVEQFKKKRMRARLTSEQLKNKTRYIVSVGEYETEPEALKDLDAVRAVCKCKPTVTKR
ncbi:MAG: SPOR domain-containing protein [Ignavibacteria bacterium]|nr:SPOR domain-containing protein [Ignavibacteria bacterium]MBP7093503.1 SPOR domain-containing protein [Candidatus Kapabacteria bacterium]MBK6419765.1 SPOR domain-containing protein [Ignavibacteria bacterium]MBK7033211.1 SPOR domain-containing protein [Ignavibacteria bacterium]MBK7184495.1 SPOR domain-containing protein [Ignavibacteria bacterium]